MTTADERLETSVYQFAVLTVGSLITVAGGSLAGLLALAAQVRLSMTPLAFRLLGIMVEQLGDALVAALTSALLAYIAQSLYAFPRRNGFPLPRRDRVAEIVQYSAFGAALLSFALIFAAAVMARPTVSALLVEPGMTYR